MAKSEKSTLITVASLPAVQRDLFLSRCIRRIDDAPVNVETLKVKWSDMVVAFSSDEAISECSVDVKEDISLVTFTRRMESLLDCAAKSDSTEWVLKWSAKISSYGDVDYVRRVLCDKVASMSKTGETVGVLKIKRRSVKSGHAKIRLVPAEDSLQLICRHTSAQGLKSVWKSVLWRLRPQFKEKESVKKCKNENEMEIIPPCIKVSSINGAYHSTAVAFLSKRGVAVDPYVELVETTIPIAGDHSTLSDCASYYCEVAFNGAIPAGMPKDFQLDLKSGVYHVIVAVKRWDSFVKYAESLSRWLSLNWDLD